MHFGRLSRDTAVGCGGNDTHFSLRHRLIGVPDFPARFTYAEGGKLPDVILTLAKNDTEIIVRVSDQGEAMF
jgi:hypothetical protein